MSQVKLSQKKLIKLANDWLNPDTSTLEGFRRFLITWYCFTYNVPFKDPVLMSHTLEELAFLFYMHKIAKDPNFAQEILNPEETASYEDWIKGQMGDDYISEEQMVKDMLEYEERERELAAQLPDSITTDFSKIGLPDGE